MVPLRHVRRLCAAATLSLLWLSGAVAAQVTVFAAASTGTALAEVAQAFEAESGHVVILSLAGSAALARQIELGAPADVFLSASVEWVDYLERQGLTAPGTRRDLLSNRLVLIAPADGAGPFDPATSPTLADRLGTDGRLAMGLVEAVPAGSYGRAALTSLGLWDAVAPRVAQTDNVRMALALVALGEAAFGIVYSTDAAEEPRVRVVHEFPPDTHPPIRYPVVAVAGAMRPEVEAFLAFLSGPKAAGIFARHHFGQPD